MNPWLQLIGTILNECIRSVGVVNKILLHRYIDLFVTPDNQNEKSSYAEKTNRMLPFWEKKVVFVNLSHAALTRGAEKEGGSRGPKSAAKLVRGCKKGVEEGQVGQLRSHKAHLDEMIWKFLHLP